MQITARESSYNLVALSAAEEIEFFQNTPETLEVDNLLPRFTSSVPGPVGFRRAKLRDTLFCLVDFRLPQYWATI